MYQLLSHVQAEGGYDTSIQLLTLQKKFFHNYVLQKCNNTSMASCENFTYIF